MPSYPITEAQYALLHTDITVTNAAEFADEVAANDDQLIADAYNLLAVPDFWVWRVDVSEQENYTATSVEGTVWSWTIYIGRSDAERDAWVRMFGPSGRLDPSLPQVRSAISDIFSAGPGAAQRTHLLALWRRRALRAEKLFASGTGSASTPGLLTFAGELTYLDVAHALRGVPI
jgi:hypothetical protein